ncbi:Fe-S cluster assembly sulfur transfer protein SufU [Paenibacillus glacialis]|uniref:Iron-sulfur cluster assembly scaffold protein NifU n=1 Tax=Paenibacillus glacialis TaxID=494026 RepID=A0A168LD74_9BACL|nr:SUF system NifU family Fe-S cluster assembly protein [Paenibacillus glacialis]OAB43221.1 iron-sulfur cluster assembly scaffold protein NifU [Paenibacillus glacialis]
MQLDDLYRQVIMDHYKNPRNKGKFEDGAITVDLNNPTCGDKITLQLKVNNGVVEDAKYTGDGCSISMSSASMMTAAVKGKTLEEARDMIARFSQLMLGEDVQFDDYEDIEALSGVNKFPARIKCATLSWNALRKVIDEEQFNK